MSDEGSPRPSVELPDDLIANWNAGGPIRIGPFRLFQCDEIDNIPQPKPLVEGVFDCESIALVYGPSGHYKSFFIHTLGMHVAAGRGWHGRKVEQGNVLYIVGEGISGESRRKEAWKTYYNMSGNLPFYYLDGCPNVLTEKGKEWVLQAAHATQPIMVILDTVARSIPGGDENDFQTMSHVVEIMERTKRAERCTVVAITHTGKNYDLGARGHSSVHAAMDTVLRVIKPRVYVEKQKHHEDGIVLCELLPQYVGNSLVVTPSWIPPRSRNAEIILSALRALGNEAGYNDLREAAQHQGCPRGSFPRELDKLVAAGLILRPDTSDTSGHYRGISR